MSDWQVIWLGVIAIAVALMARGGVYEAVGRAVKIQALLDGAVERPTYRPSKGNGSGNGGGHGSASGNGGGS